MDFFKCPTELYSPKLGVSGVSPDYFVIGYFSVFFVSL